MSVGKKIFSKKMITQKLLYEALAVRASKIKCKWNYRKKEN